MRFVRWPVGRLEVARSSIKPTRRALRTMATDIQQLTLDAQNAGYRVWDDEDGLWWVTVPARPRYPENVQGAFRDSRRAWRVAVLLHRETTPPVATG